MTDYIVVLVTILNKREAEGVAKYLVENKFAACVNMIEGVKSTYWWEGKVDQSKEVQLVIKTHIDLYDELVKAIQPLQSYDVPEILALPIVKGTDDYLNWMKDILGK